MGRATPCRIGLVFIVSIFVASGLVAGVALTPCVRAASLSSAPVRIGTYDNRSIAVAFAASRFNPVRQKMAEYTAAVQRGDRDRADELKAWGEKAQRELHFQGFGRAPVGDLLKHVSVEMAALAEVKGLKAVVAECDYTAEGVEVVDITDELVELFDPSDQTREMARGIRKADPVPLVSLAEMRDVE